MSTTNVTEERNNAFRASKSRVNLNTLGIFLIFAGIALGLGYPLIKDGLLQLLAAVLSPDGSIRPEGIRKTTCAFYSGVLLIIGAGVVLRAAINPELRARLIGAITRESVCYPAAVRPSPILLLIVSTIVGLFLIVHIQMYDPNSETFRILYLEDGFFESITPALMVAAAVLLIRSAMLLRRMTSSTKLRVWVAGFYLLSAICFILYAGEEISWGQRIIGWSTPETFSGNLQNETNIHNFYNTSFHLVYKAMVIVPLFILPSLLLELGKRQAKAAKLIFPHVSIIGLACLIGFTSLLWHQQQELLEELIAVFVLLYSVRAYSCIRAMRSLDAST